MVRVKVRVRAVWGDEGVRVGLGWVWVMVLLDG